MSTRPDYGERPRLFSRVLPFALLLAAMLFLTFSDRAGSWLDRVFLAIA